MEAVSCPFRMVEREGGRRERGSSFFMLGSLVGQGRPRSGSKNEPGHCAQVAKCAVCPSICTALTPVAIAGHSREMRWRWGQPLGCLFLGPPLARPQSLRSPHCSQGSLCTSHLLWVGVPAGLCPLSFRPRGEKGSLLLPVWGPPPPFLVLLPL